MTDTCGWCHSTTTNIQINPGGVSLCPTCCPDIDEDEIPDNIPSQWHFMDEEERQDWIDGMTVEEIAEKHDWLYRYGGWEEGTVHG